MYNGYNPNSQLEELNARKSNLSVMYLDTKCMNSISLQFNIHKPLVQALVLSKALQVI